MTATEHSETARELYECVPEYYLPTLLIMFELVPLAKANFEVGNVHTAFKLLGSAPVQVNERWKITKQQMLAIIMLALPSMYQVGDLDPSFQA